MTSEAHDVTVVVDVGSGWLRGGLAGEDAPRCELPVPLQHAGNEVRLYVFVCLCVN